MAQPPSITGPPQPAAGEEGSCGDEHHRPEQLEPQSGGDALRRDISAEDPQRDILHSSKGAQLSQLPQTLRQEGQGHHRASQQLRRRYRQHHDPVGVGEKERQGVDKKRVGADHHQHQCHCRKKCQEYRGRYPQSEAVGGRDQNAHQQDRHRPQGRPTQPESQRPGHPHGVEVCRPGELIGHAAVFYGLHQVHLPVPHGKKGQKGLLEPDIGGERLHAHRKTVRVGQPRRPGRGGSPWSPIPVGCSCPLGRRPGTGVPPAGASGKKPDIVS